MIILIIYVITALIALVTGIGIYLTVKSIRDIRQAERRLNQQKEKLTLAQRIRRYEGPVRPGRELFNAPARVGIEFFTAICGFPGLGWLVSGKIVAGMLLITTVPIFVWAVFPLYLSIAQPLLPSPFFPVQYLPFIGLLSSASLAVNQLMTAKKRKAEQQA